MERGEVAIATGGSSGKMRFAVQTENTLGDAAGSLVEYLGGKRLWVRAELPAYHVSGLMPFVRAAVSGGRIGDEFERAGSPDCCRMVSMVGTQLVRWLRDGAVGAEGIDLLVVGGGPVAEEVLREARRRVGEVWMTYGMTETGGMVAVDPDGRGGRLLSGRTLRVGRDGEIEVGRLGRALRYLGGDRFGEWMRTGDRGLWDGERLRVVGRIRRQIVSGGEKVDPEEVQAALKLFGGVLEAVVVAVPDPEWGERVGVWIEDRSGRSGAEIVDCLRGRIAAYKRPRRVLVSEELPRNEMGKVRFEEIRREVIRRGVDLS